MKIESKTEIKAGLQELLIQVGLRITKRGEGALFIVGNIEHKPLVEQTIHSFNVLKNPKLLESLALMDGAVIIDNEGNLVAYGTMIKSTKVFKNYGTRHSAAISASKKGNLVVVVSEEDKRIRVFKDGKLIMQVDALEKGIEKSVSESIKVLESIGAGTIGGLIIGLMIPGLNVYFVPEIAIIGFVYYTIKYLSKKIKGEKR